MSKRERKIAEHEYYEKICRLERWITIDRLFTRIDAEISTMINTCTENAKARYDDEEYCARCREERQLLNVILEGISELRDSAVHEGVSKYTAEKPARPNHLP